MAYNVLIVCHANVSRSVMAQAILQRRLDDRGHRDTFHLTSGGVAYYARDGALASLDARLVLQDIGIEISRDTASTDLKRHRQLIEQADIIFAMTAEQVEMLAQGFPEASGKRVFTLAEYAGEAGDIEDPQGQSETVFAACRDEIQACIEKSVDRLIEDAASLANR